MEAEEKKKFVRQLILNVEIDILKKVDKMPEEWDGHELRQYIADQFARCVIGDYMTNKKSRRFKDYRNVMETTDL